MKSSYLHGCRNTLQDQTITQSARTSGVSSMGQERGAWSSQLEFVLSCLNYAVGLGNVWRFPYLVFRNGGGAFLVPYIVMLFAMGLPIFFLELAIGQYSGMGPNKAFQRMAPIFHGLGYCTLVVITLVTIYYQVIVAWTIFYVFASFTSELGWGSCGHDFNTDDCYSEAANAECLSKSENESWPLTFIQRTCRPVGEICAENNQTMHNHTHCFNGTYNHLNAIVQRVLSSEEYYRDYALGINGATWESWGILRWEMVLCLLLSWIILYLCLMKGVQSSGKVTYFTAFFPYCVLLALLVRGVTLDGAYEGILFYVTPSWESLTNANVWGDAASQTFYALGIGCGSLVTLSSYNRFNNNCHRDAFIVSVANTLTAILAGFVVFAILGFLAKESGVSVKEVVSSGPGLAFITYPEAVLRMPLPQLWAILFFIMLFTLGTGSQFAGVEAINTAIIDQWPSLCKRKQWVAASTCAACFVLALPMCCSGGVYLFTVLDWNTASWAILIIGFAEVALVGWVYGCRCFLDNITEMSMHLSKFTRVYWSISWTVLAPAFLVGVLILTLNNFTPAYYGEYTFPEWVDGLGWLIGLASILPLPAFALYRLFRAKEVGWELLQPSKLWGPAQSTTLNIPTFGVYENSEKHYNAYENNDKPNSACDNFENCSWPGSVVVKMEPEPVHNRQSDARAYENLAFHHENGRKAFLCQNHTNS